MSPEVLLQPPSFISLSTFVLALSIVTANLEVQIEGEYGWAKKLPTWRYGPPWLLNLFNGKELTGYHFWLFTMFVLFFHLPVLFSPRWSWPLEFSVLSSLALFTVFWDYLWFVFNPSFGLRKYNKHNIWWFRNWIGPFPRDYYFGLFFSAFFACMHGISGHLGVKESLFEWAIGALVCVVGVFVVTVWHILFRKPVIRE